MTETTTYASTEAAAVTYDADEHESMTEAVVAAVSSISDSTASDGTFEGEASDAVNLRPLYEVVDPDALNALMQSTWHDERADGIVSFTYCGYNVTVETPGMVTVSENAEAE